MLDQVISAIAAWIVAVISAGGYFGIVVLMAIESACIPLTSEIIMPFSGYLVSVGRFSLIGAATAGALGFGVATIGLMKNHGAVKLICKSIRTRLRRNFGRRKSGIALERIADARSIYEAHGSFLLNRMITAAEYRAWAEESLEWALHATNESSRQAFIGWAEIWLESALRVERIAALQEHLSKEPLATAEYVWQLPPFQDWPRKGTRFK